MTKLHITRAGRKHALAIAQHSYPRPSRATYNAAYEHSQDSDDEIADTEEPEARSSSATHYSRASSRAPLHGPASESDHARSPSIPDSEEGLGPIIEIKREASIRRDWDIYAKRNDLML